MLKKWLFGEGSFFGDILREANKEGGITKGNVVLFLLLIIGAAGSMYFAKAWVPGGLMIFFSPVALFVNGDNLKMILMISGILAIAATVGGIAHLCGGSSLGWGALGSLIAGIGGWYLFR